MCEPGRSCDASSEIHVGDPASRTPRGPSSPGRVATSPDEPRTSSRRRPGWVPRSLEKGTARSSMAKPGRSPPEEQLTLMFARRGPLRGGAPSDRVVVRDRAGQRRDRRGTRHDDRDRATSLARRRRPRGWAASSRRTWASGFRAGRAASRRGDPLRVRAGTGMPRPPRPRLPGGGMAASLFAVADEGHLASTAAWPPPPSGGACFTPRPRPRAPASSGLAGRRSRCSAWAMSQYQRPSAGRRARRHFPTPGRPRGGSSSLA